MTSALTGHGGDVQVGRLADPLHRRCASGGKDSLVKLWDAKSGSAVATIHAHKNQVGLRKWNQNGNWLVSGCRGSQVKVFDGAHAATNSRARRLGGDVRGVAPVFFTTTDGTILYWLVGQRGGDPRRVRGGTAGSGPSAWETRGAHHVQRVERQHAVQVLVSQQTGEVPRDTTRSGPAAMAEQAPAVSMMNASDARVISGGGSGYRPSGNRRGKTGRRRPRSSPPSAEPPCRRAAAGEATSASTAAGKTTAARAAAGRAEGIAAAGGAAPAPARRAEPLRRSSGEGRAERGRRGAAGPRAGGGGQTQGEDPGVVRGRSVRRARGRDVNDAGWGWEPTIERLSVWWKAVGRFGRMRGWQPRGAVGVRRSCSEDRWRGLARETNALYRL